MLSMNTQESQYSPYLPMHSGLTAWFDRDFAIVSSNQMTADLFGFSCVDSMLGVKPAEIHCPAAECADDFIHQFEQVFSSKKEKMILDVHPYADGINHSFITTKRPLFNNNDEVFAIECRMTEVPQKNLNRLLCQLLMLDKRYNDNAQISYETDLNSTSKPLSAREEECIFFLIRGASIKEIARFMHLSPRTVEAYLNNIKIKFDCHTKAQVIEYAIANGILPFIPKSILNSSNVSIPLI